MFSWGTFQRIFETKIFSKKKKKKGCFAPLCVPLGLKKPGTSQCPKVTGTTSPNKTNKQTKHLR
jgi:hypothetical protein